jgi:DNA-binding LytR/AlgR family response regulator
MILETISYDEVLSFQNEYIQIVTFNKNFLSYLMNKIKVTSGELKEKISIHKDKIEYNEKYVKDIQNQKESLYEIILK